MNMIDRKLVDIINKRVEDYKTSSTPLSQNQFYISQIMLCSRRLYYIKKGYEEPFDLSKEKYFLVGNIFHDFIQNKIFKSVQFTNEQQIRISEPPIELRGRADTMSNKFIYEFKTCMFLPKTYNLNHLIQLNLYLSKHEDKKGVLIYISKNNFEMEEYTFLFNKKLYDTTIERVKTIYEYMTTDTIPAKEEDSNCKHCSFIEKCKGDEK